MEERRRGGKLSVGKVDCRGNRTQGPIKEEEGDHLKRTV